MLKPYLNPQYEISVRKFVFVVKRYYSDKCLKTCIKEKCYTKLIILNSNPNIFKCIIQSEAVNFPRCFGNLKLALDSYYNSQKCPTSFMKMSIFIMLSSVNNLIVKEGRECILYNTMQILRHIQDYSEVKIKENIKTHLIIIKYLSLIAFLSFILWANFKPLIFSFKRFPSINAHAIANIVHALNTLNTNIFKNILKSSKKSHLTILPHFMLLCIFINSTDKVILKTINENK